jgi:hypothetical protein
MRNFSSGKGFWITGIVTTGIVAYTLAFLDNKKRIAAEKTSRTRTTTNSAAPEKFRKFG